ncbi:bifunctional adenosylcobinamide kinase/adenosylcobinamide-phosphate guanylyltransferase [Vibrio astriarenae]|jgi:adenosylcobinamide kinase/adenosylcobinamide-phosphate guanylyltransferase
MITLVLGGARSGKSSYAEQKIIEQSPSDAMHYIATAQGLDDEMNRRIEHHKAHRDKDWLVEEIPLEVARRLVTANAGDWLLVDCLTLWLTNVIVNIGDSVTPMKAEHQIRNEVEELVLSLNTTQANVVLVSNEVGLGVMPLGEITRRYVDHAGWMNQAIAKVADHVVFVAAGLPIALKGEV